MASLFLSSVERKEDNHRKDIQKRCLPEFDLKEFINALDADGAEQAKGLALRYNFSKLQMSVLHSYSSGVHKVSAVHK